jgi:hypothetical protein
VAELTPNALDKEATLRWLRRFADLRLQCGAADEYHALTLAADELAGGIFDLYDFGKGGI